MRRALLATGILILTALACGQAQTVVPPPQATADPTPPPHPTTVSRYSAIPAVEKMTLADGPWPPAIAPGWTQPVPLDRPVNTIGAEDSPFITPDGQTLYFFFTPDVRVPVEQQLFDGVTGIWVTHRTGDGWSEPERVPLANPGELHLDGCEFVLNDWMVFCSAREGNAREIDLYTATLQDGVWNEPVNLGPQINTAGDEISAIQQSAARTDTQSL